MPYFFTPAQRAILEGLIDGRNPLDANQHFDDVYRTLADFISGSDDPDVQVVEVFFRGAVQVNAGFGNFSEMIRAYTARQLQLRSADVPTGEALDDLVQQASNAIASNIVNDILGRLEGRPNPDGRLPRIIEIAEQDASGAVLQFFAGRIVAGDTSVTPSAAGWAGTPFFSHFGDWELWRVLSAGEQGTPSTADYTLNRLDDLKNVLFALDAMHAGLSAQTREGFIAAIRDDLLTPARTAGPTARALLVALAGDLGFGTTARPTFCGASAAGFREPWFE